MNHHSSHLTGSVQLRLYSPFTPRAVIHGASCVSANMTAVCHPPPKKKEELPNTHPQLPSGPSRDGLAR